MTSKNNLTFRTTGIFLFLFALSEIGYADSIPLAYRYLESPNSCNMDITHGSDHRNVEKINLKIQKEIKTLTPLAEKGSTVAQKRLVAIYDYQILSDDRSRYECRNELRIKYRKLLAENNDPESQFEIGYAYMVGNSLPKNYERSFEWYKKAIIGGNVNAREGMAMLYEWHLEHRYDKAIFWYSLAAIGGSETGENKRNEFETQSIKNGDYISVRKMQSAVTRCFETGWKDCDW